MKKNFRRQLKDIQNEADKLLNENPSLIDIMNFQKYSDEMVKYIKKYSDSTEILAKLEDLPQIIDLNDNQKKGIFTFLFAGPFGFLFGESKKINLALQHVREAKSVYSSVEFLLARD